MWRPALPRTIEDLGEWSVYADHLLTIGDPLGDRIVADLALPASPLNEQLRGFMALVGRHCPSSQTLIRSWCLGFLHSLELTSRDDAAVYHVEHGALAQARDVLRSRAAERLEELSIPTPPRDDTHYRRMLAALPASCRRVTLTEFRSRPESVDFVISCLPPTVTELGVRMYEWKPAIARAVVDRFTTVDLYLVKPMTQLADLMAAVAATSTVDVQISSCHGPLPPRLALGGPGDAAIATFDRAWTLERDRAPRVTLPVRELLAAETTIKDVCLDPELRVAHPKVTLLRRDGTWTAKSWQPLTIDDRVIEPQTVVPIRDGARLESGGRRGVFFARDVDAQSRAVLGGEEVRS